MKGVPSKRSRIEDRFVSPSDYGKSKRSYSSICDHRTCSSLHTSLQVEAFGKFLDEMKREEDEIDAKYYEAAGSLMNQMRRNYSNETECRHAFASALVGIFPPFLSVSKGRATSDCTTCVTIKGERYIVVNWEFKNGMVGITSEPYQENQGYYVHLKAGNSDRSPMLLVSVVGCHYLQVFGAVWNGSRVCVDPLSDPVPRDPWPVFSLP